MKRFKLYAKKYLSQVMIRLILGRVSPRYLEALVENAKRSNATAFAQRGYIYRELKSFNQNSTQVELDTATQLVLLVDEVDHELKER